MLGARGAVVIDADAVAREVSAPGQPAHDEILAAFGAEVRAADGSVDRAALARLAFGDPDALRRLEAIVHPRVRPAIVDRIEAAVLDGAPAVVIEAIKLIEGGLAELCDEVWLVDCTPDDQRARLTGRGMDPGDADRRIAAQGDLRERLAPHSTHTIDTSGSEEDVEAAVIRHWAGAGAATP
jgi:dephospho-CoA kinase